MFGYYALIEKLLQMDDVEDMKPLSPDVKDLNGATALHLSKDVRTLNTLLAYGAQLSAKDFEGNEPLHTKCFGQKNKPSELDVIECLIDCHAKLTVANRQGFMPIHQAAMQGRIDVITLLLKKDTKKVITRALSSESYSSTYR